MAALAERASARIEGAFRRGKFSLPHLLKRPSSQSIGLFLVLSGFLTWAAFFVYRSSFVTYDGDRYFCLFDDAMISMRYAWNLAHGNGLVWNVGERVEGITNLLMTLYMTLMMFVLDKKDAVLAIQISGIGFVIAVGYFCIRIGDHLIESTPLARRPGMTVLFLVCAFLYYPLDYWALMGMEPGLLAALLTASVWLSMRAGNSTRVNLWLGLLLGLSYLTRPDALVFASLVFAHRLAGIWRRPGWLKTIALELSVFGFFVAGTTLFRLAYYRSLVPNTYVLKMTGLTLYERLENGMGFVTPLIDSLWLPLVFALIVVLLDRRRDVSLIVGLVYASIAYHVYVGGDPWRYWRHSAPFVPLLFVLVVVEISQWVNWAKGNPLARYSAFRFASKVAGIETLVAAVVLLVVAEKANRQFEKEYRFDVRPYTVRANQDNVADALALNDIAGADASVGVTWAGAIPYYTGLRAVDFLGKSDSYIAALPPDREGGAAFNGMSSVPGHNKYDLRYSIQEEKPTFIQTSRWGRQNLDAWVARHYRVVRHKGTILRLLENSPDILWRRLESAAIRSR